MKQHTGSVDRIACIDLPALPLQLLLRRQRDWREQPVAVVDRDKPQGVILHVNERALQSRILPGMRYAAGLSLCRDLRAGVVPATEVLEQLRAITRRLWCFSPRVEPSEEEPGVFWLDASGLGRLYPSLDGWATHIREDLARAGFQARVTVGFSRFGSYAAGKTTRTQRVFHSPEEERAQNRRVPIVRLGLEPALRDVLLELGIDTVGKFLKLPAAGVRRRFGEAAYHLHQLGRGRSTPPLSPLPHEERVVSSMLLDHTESSVDRLLASIETLLRAQLQELARHYEALTHIELTLVLDDDSEIEEELRPAEATLDEGFLLGLLRLRLESLARSRALGCGVIELRLHASGVATSDRQLNLFPEASRQHLDALDRALARLRAELGNDAVVRARLQEGHLPEASFTWEPLEHMSSPRPRAVPLRTLVRRLYPTPIALGRRQGREPDGWFIGGFADGPVEEMIGPHVVSGGWWVREVHRAYYFARTRSGRWLWLYDDRERRQWFLQGEVE